MREGVFSFIVVKKLSVEVTITVAIDIPPYFWTLNAFYRFSRPVGTKKTDLFCEVET